jgi:4-aminobutyrate aminotransferase
MDRKTMAKDCDLAEKVMYYALKNGMNFKVSGGNVIQLSPALIINREELQRAVNIIDNALQELS